MHKTKKNSTLDLAKQLSLIDSLFSHSDPEDCPDFRVAERLAETATRMIVRSGKSRNVIAAEMSDLLGYAVTVHMLNAATAPSKEAARWPAEWVPALAHITGDHSQYHVLAKVVRGCFLSSKQAIRAEIVRLDEEVERLQKSRDDIRNLLPLLGD